jgi:type IV pilus assembly protein PilP
MRRKGFLTMSVAATCLILFSGCGEQPAPPPAAQPKKVAPKPAAPSPQPGQTEVVAPRYVYNPSGKRDPFENPLDQVQGPAHQVEAPLTPLQKFDLGQFRLIGVIVGKGSPAAMVLAPDGKSFILKKGTKIGKNNGTVVRITPESVRVEEEFFDFSGEVRKAIQEIQLPKREGV